MVPREPIVLAYEESKGYRSRDKKPIMEDIQLHIGQQQSNNAKIDPIIPGKTLYDGKLDHMQWNFKRLETTIVLARKNQ